MFLRILEWLALENNDRFQVLRDELSRLELVTSAIVLNAELKHVQNVSIKNTP